MSNIKSTVETTETVETIHTSELTAVTGGADEPASYNGQDVKNAAAGAQAGSRFGLPGAIIGGGLGFMSRNVGNLVDAGRDYWNERQRGAALDEKIKNLPKR